MECENCHSPTDRNKGFEVGDSKLLCPDCFADLGQKMFASSREVVGGADRKKQLRKWAREHSVELIPRETLRGICEEGVRKILTQQLEPEEAYGWMVNQLSYATGMAAERRVLQVIRGIQGALEGGIAEMEKETQENMRKLGELGGI